MAEDDTLLTRFQIEVGLLFFELPRSEGFLLAGGGALLAQRLISRTTQDLGFFTWPDGGNVRTARDELVEAARERGWAIEHVQDHETFCRLLIHGPEDLLVDLALDSPPGRPASVSIIGPTFAPEELAGRKVVALFDRAAARDFVDVYALNRTFTKQVLLEHAAEVDAGFDLTVFAEMLDHHTRYANADLELGDVDVAAVREFFRQWAAELRSERT